MLQFVASPDAVPSRTTELQWPGACGPAGALRRTAGAARHVVRPDRCREWFRQAGYVNASERRGQGGRNHPRYSPYCCDDQLRPPGVWWVSTKASGPRASGRHWALAAARPRQRVPQRRLPQAEISFVGTMSGLVRQPKGNGCIERFFRTPQGRASLGPPLLNDRGSARPSSPATRPTSVSS